MSQQELLYQLSQMVCAAYAAYTTTGTKNANVIAGNPAAHHPAAIPAEAAVLRAQPNLKNVCPIYVYEAEPDLDPSAPAPTLHSENLAVRKKRGVPNNVVPGTDCGGGTATHEGGYQLFGFTATLPAVGELKAKNVLALRGTVTAYEAGVSLIDWDIDPSNCAIPTTGWDPTPQGKAQASYWEFYSGGRWLDETPLSASIQKAIMSTAAKAPGLPWFATAHSLGGGMLSLGVFDALLAGRFPNNNPPCVVTFGSVVVGDDVFATKYTEKIPNTIRVANLCDFVPSLRGLTPGPPIAPFTHVGTAYLFVWQTDSDWANHSLGDIYMKVVGSPELYSNIYVSEPPPVYPVGIEKFGRIEWETGLKT
jgi:hypothetical protein